MCTGYALWILLVWFQVLSCFGNLRFLVWLLHAVQSRNHYTGTAFTECEPCAQPQPIHPASIKQPASHLPSKTLPNQCMQKCQSKKATIEYRPPENEVNTATPPPQTVILPFTLPLCNQPVESETYFCSQVPPSRPFWGPTSNNHYQEASTSYMPVTVTSHHLCTQTAQVTTVASGIYKSHSLTWAPHHLDRRQYHCGHLNTKPDITPVQYHHDFCVASLAKIQHQSGQKRACDVQGSLEKDILNPPKRSALTSFRSPFCPSVESQLPPLATTSHTRDNCLSGHAPGSCTEPSPAPREASGSVDASEEEGSMDILSEYWKEVMGTLSDIVDTASTPAESASDESDVIHWLFDVFSIE